VNIGALTLSFAPRLKSFFNERILYVDSDDLLIFPEQPWRLELLREPGGPLEI